MSLRIVYGKAGTGKSQFIYNDIEKIMKDGAKEKIFIITPEQFSFTAEKKLMENKKAIINAEVITFNRMAYRVLNEVGGIKNNLTKSGKSMLIYSILQQEKKNLLLLNKTDENIDLCIRTISEFKKNKISITDLKNELKNINDEYLKIKLQDMILIYEKFELNIENKYIDETDLLTRLENNIEKTNIFNNSLIYIDEFVGFTKQELSIIKKLEIISKKITITFCTDNLDFNTNPDIDVFYPNKVTLNKILKIINKEEKIEIINLDKLYRFKNEELIFIENNLFNKNKNNYLKQINNIKLFLAKNKYSEIENIAKNIILLIKNNNYKYSEISIITKNIDSYSSIIKSIFSKYDIPVFIDEKKDLNQNILIRYILSILEIIINNYSYESVFNYLKNPFLNLDENDIFKLEKYVIKYGIKNNKFKQDFIYGLSDNNKEEINYLNELRKKIINPLISLENKINKKQNIEKIINEFYLFLINENIEIKIKEKINKLENKYKLKNIKLKNIYIKINNKKIKYYGKIYEKNKIKNLINKNTIKNNLELAKEYKLSYEIIINIFKEIKNIFKDEKITLDNFYKIFKIGLKNSDLGKIPPSQDQVIVGDTERSRTQKVKAVFIIGLNDGVFPSVNKDEGFFNDSDRDNLKENGIELAKGTIENIYDDNFNIYKAFTTAEEKLFLSYISTDIDGKTLRPSNLIFKIKKLFKLIKEESDILENNLNNFYSEKSLYDFLILNINYFNNKNNDLIKINKKEKNEELKSNNLILLYKYFIANKKYEKKLKNNFNYLKSLKIPEKIKKENIQKLYGNKLITSVSKLEMYKSCPYEYFLQYSLKLKEREELKIKNIDTGSFMHEIIDLFFQELNHKNINIKNIDEETTEKIIDKNVDEKLQENKNYIFNATKKYKLLVKRLKRIILKAIKYIIYSLISSDFEILGTEISFDEKKGNYPPIKIDLKNGKKVEIVGKIDRVDLAKDENNKYIRIIDYKSSVKDMDFTNIYGGLQLQLITYLDAMCKIEDFIPAGILYFNLLEQIINTDKKLTQEEIEEKIRNNFKMKGLILADVKVALMQDNNLTPSSSSKLIPAYMDKDGNLSPKKSNILSKEEFTKLQDFVNKTIKEIADEILNGNIELRPYYKNKKTPCEYCAYKNICGFNAGIFKEKYRYVNAKTKEDFFKL